jgi:hypothetical protein
MPNCPAIPRIFFDEKGPEKRARKPFAPEFALLSPAGIQTVPFGHTDLVLDRVPTIEYDGSAMAGGTKGINHSPQLWTKEWRISHRSWKQGEK